MVFYKKPDLSVADKIFKALSLSKEKLSTAYIEQPPEKIDNVLIKPHSETPVPYQDKVKEQSLKKEDTIILFFQLYKEIYLLYDKLVQSNHINYVLDIIYIIKQISDLYYEVGDNVIILSQIAIDNKISNLISILYYLQSLNNIFEDSVSSGSVLIINRIKAKSFDEIPLFDVISPTDLLKRMNAESLLPKIKENLYNFPITSPSILKAPQHIITLKKVFDSYSKLYSLYNHVKLTSKNFCIMNKINYLYWIYVTYKFKSFYFVINYDIYSYIYKTLLITAHDAPRECGKLMHDHNHNYKFVNLSVFCDKFGLYTRLYADDINKSTWYHAISGDRNNIYNIRESYINLGKIGPILTYAKNTLRNDPFIKNINATNFIILIKRIIQYPFLYELITKHKFTIFSKTMKDKYFTLVQPDEASDDTIYIKTIITDYAHLIIFEDKDYIKKLFNVSKLYFYDSFNICSELFVDDVWYKNFIIRKLSRGLMPRPEYEYSLFINDTNNIISADYEGNPKHTTYAANVRYKKPAWDKHNNAHFVRFSNMFPTRKGFKLGTHHDYSMIDHIIFQSFFKQINYNIVTQIINFDVSPDENIPYYTKIIPDILSDDSFYIAIITYFYEIKQYTDDICENDMADTINTLRVLVADHLSIDTYSSLGLNFSELLFMCINDECDDFYKFIVKYASTYLDTNGKPLFENIINKFKHTKCDASIIKSYNANNDDDPAFLLNMKRFLFDIYTEVMNDSNNIKIYNAYLIKFYKHYIICGGRANSLIEPSIIAELYNCVIIIHSQENEIKRILSRADIDDTTLYISLVQENVIKCIFNPLWVNGYNKLFIKSKNDCDSKTKKTFEYLISTITYSHQQISDTLYKNSKKCKIITDFMLHTGLKPYILNIIRDVGKNSTIYNLDSINKEEKHKYIEKLIKYFKITYIYIHDNDESLATAYSLIAERFIKCYADYVMDTLDKIKKILCYMILLDQEVFYELQLLKKLYIFNNKSQINFV